ncbi:MAG: NADH-quinone oxidoreductase subunit NuoE [Rhodobiaceae bacterium]|nr:NADH-quinone oxidoreductase subunit NuoE [Rhodobiaceae bacterium]MCC0041324.1 NADH-quinone oxidoreductase subunit NuoE [Rhodobiaceae bacterium]MCC0052695.1 NADH-quinone oxidoreductase subunit NuoE [Rhodobiaceae bacterium]
MSVRRLHHEQPASFAFTRENLAWAKQQIGKYPKGREASAVIPLLWRAQEQHENWLPEPAIRYIADMLGMPYIRVLEVATFYTMFQLAPVGKKAHVQVCGTTPCMLRGAEDIKAVCKRRIAEHAHELSADGEFSWEEVECLGACVNAPMVQVFSDTYEDLTAESFERLLDAFARGDKPQPGPQIDRQFAAPFGGDTTLTTLAGKAAAKAPAKPAAKPTAKAPAKAAPVAALAAPALSADDAARADAAGKKPRMMKAPRKAGADDLKMIKGVGPKLEGVLNGLGIFHFDQISAWKPEEVSWVDEYLKFKGRIVRDDWIAQASTLAGGGETEFSKRVAKGEVPSSKR